MNKTALAKQMGVSRSMLYYKYKRPIIDEEVKKQIESVLTDHPAYGHKRIALELKLNKKRILRVMKKFKIKPYKRRVKKPRKVEDEGKPETSYKNLIELICPIAPHVVWVADFTYIKFQDKFMYLATIMDLYSREILGWNISRYHNKELVLGALLDAMNHTGRKPQYLHSDQGSEYDSQEYVLYAEREGIQISMSRKGHPWENGYKESFYSGFKLDLGNVSRFQEIGELIESIHQTMYYYNHRRIHTSLKMSPVQFRRLYEERFRQTV